MLDYDVYRIRRISLNWSKEQLAAYACIPVKYVDYFEDGALSDRIYIKKIKNAIDEYHRSLSDIDHRKARVIELAYIVAEEKNYNYLMKNIGHLQVELGFLQMTAADGKLGFRDKDEWED